MARLVGFSLAGMRTDMLEAIELFVVFRKELVTTSAQPLELA